MEWRPSVPGANQRSLGVLDLERSWQTFGTYINLVQYTRIHDDGRHSQSVMCLVCQQNGKGGI